MWDQLGAGSPVEPIMTELRDWLHAGASDQRVFVAYGRAAGPVAGAGLERIECRTIAVSRRFHSVGDLLLGQSGGRRGPAGKLGQELRLAARLKANNHPVEGD